MQKRFLSVLLILCIVLTVMPRAAWAANTQEVVYASTTEELKIAIKSNTKIILQGKDYNVGTEGLLLQNLQNVTIQGTSGTRIIGEESYHPDINGTDAWGPIIFIDRSTDIRIQNVSIGYTSAPTRTGTNNTAVRAIGKFGITIVDCDIFGADEGLLLNPSADEDSVRGASFHMENSTIRNSIFNIAEISMMERGTATFVGCTFSGNGLGTRNASDGVPGYGESHDYLYPYSFSGYSYYDLPVVFSNCTFTSNKNPGRDSLELLSGKEGTFALYSNCTFSGNSWAVPFNITYNLAGGTGDVPGGMCIDSGTVVRIPTEKPTRTGYMFAGWSDGQRTYQAGEQFTMPERDLTLTAQWTQQVSTNPMFSYDLNDNNEAIAVGIPQSERKVPGEMIIVTTVLPERKGYRFVGWSDGKKTYKAGDFFSMPDTDLVLFAQWKKLYSLGFKLDGGTGSIPPDPAYYVEGELVTLPAAPSKEGVDFAGWFDGLQTHPAGSQFTMPGNDLVLKALWNKELLYVQQLTQYSLAYADSTTKETIQNAIYNLLFKAQFRPIKGPTVNGISVTFTGSEDTNASWPAQNKDPNVASVTDGILDYVPFNEKGRGCMSYALFATAYVYGTSGTKIPCNNRSASGIKAFFHQYADPGEHIRYTWNNGESMHSIVFLGESADGNGFYYISYGGGVYPGHPTYHTIEVAYSTYANLVSKATNSLTIRDTNSGSYSSDKVTTNSKTIKRIVPRLECPIEATVTYGGEVLDSRNPGSASFGTVVQDDDAIVFDLEYHTDYLLEIFGTGEGKMTLTLDYYYDEEHEDLADRRKIIGVPITISSEIYSSGFDYQASFVLYVNENGDEVSTWGAGANETTIAPDADYSSANNPRQYW